MTGLNKEWSRAVRSWATRMWTVHGRVLDEKGRGVPGASMPVASKSNAGKLLIAFSANAPSAWLTFPSAIRALVHARSYAKICRNMFGQR